MAYLTGKRIVDMVHEDLRPSKILTKEAFHNAIVVNSSGVTRRSELLLSGGHSVGRRDRVGAGGGGDFWEVRWCRWRRSAPASEPGTSPTVFDTLATTGA